MIGTGRSAQNLSESETMHALQHAPDLKGDRGVRAPNIKTEITAEMRHYNVELTVPSLYVL